MANSDWEDVKHDDGQWEDVHAPAAEVPIASSAATGLMQSLPFAHQIGAAGKTAMDVATGITDPSDAMDEYRGERDNLKQDLTARSAAHPAASFVGSLGGMAMMPLGTSAGAMAGYGGANALANSNADLTKGEFGQAAKDTAIGAGFGGLVGAGVNAASPYVSSAFDKLTPKVADYLKGVANRQSAAAMGASKATYNKLGQAGVEDVGRYGLDNKLFGPLSSTEDMLSNNQAVKDAAMASRKSAYDTIDQAGASQFNPGNAAAKVEADAGQFNRLSPLNSGQNAQLQNTLDAIKLRGSDNIPMSQAQDLVEELGKQAKFNNMSSSGANDVAKDAYSSIRGSINDAADAASDATGVPGLKDTIQNANSTYASAKNAQKLMQGQLNGELGNSGGGIFNLPTALGAAPATGGASVAAYAGKTVFKKAGEFANQNAALGADFLGDVVKSTPQALGKWAPVLTQAAARGGNSLAATDFILQQTDPAFRQHLASIKAQQDDQQ